MTTLVKPVKDTGFADNGQTKGGLTPPECTLVPKLRSTAFLKTNAATAAVLDGVGVTSQHLSFCRAWQCFPDTAIISYLDFL